MNLVVDKHGFTKVYDGDAKLGTVSRWCCGTDFRPEGKKGLFSILELKRDDPRVFDCIQEILQFDLDNLPGHYNYQHSDYRGSKTFEQVKAWFDEKAREYANHHNDQR